MRLDSFERSFNAENAEDAEKIQETLACYFPIQNVEKMRVSISSVVVSPVICPR